MALDYRSIKTFETRDLALSLKLLAEGARLYAQDISLENPELSPIHMRLDGFPPLHLCCGGLDMFEGDVRIFSKKVQEYRIPNEFVFEPSGMHAYPLYVDSPESERTIASQVDFVKSYPPRYQNRESGRREVLNPAPHTTGHTDLTPSMQNGLRD